jgi:penicillin-binding protein 1C
MNSDDWHVPVYFQSNGAESTVPGSGQMSNGKRQRTGREISPPLSSVIGNTSSASPQPTFHHSLPSFDFTSLWQTFNAMQEVMRPGEEGLWGLFNSAQRIAWKTGTSFGFRDGWAIGLTAKFCVVVWVGNTDGEGRPELTGINTAAPVMFDIFKLLPVTPWFQPPGYDFTYLPICSESGYKAGAECYNVDTMMVSSKGKNTPLCPFHRIIHLDHTGTFRATENCEAPSAMVHKSWFVLPPAMEFYYKAKHQDYVSLPAYLPGCTDGTGRQMEMIYPEANARIYVPLEISGEKGKTILTATHRRAKAKLFWHLNGDYIGTTDQFHQMAVNPSKGAHTITIVDEQGETITRRIEILVKERD